MLGINYATLLANYKMIKQVAYLGPPGTFCEEAAQLYDSKSELSSFLSITAVGAAVVTEMVDEGIVPIENSIEGSVPETLDLLIQEARLHIREEVVLPIRHYLLCRGDTQSQDIEVIFSHPQPLAQCRNFLERCFSKSQIHAALSTSTAVEQMMSYPESSAAIGTLRAANIYGASVLAKDIQDRSPNLTRFVVVGRADHDPTGSDKTSLCFSFADDHPGLLYQALKEFADQGINLTKVESRPSKHTLGKYVFLVDLDGHRTDSRVAKVLANIQKNVDFLKVFGSYPRCDKWKA